MSYGGFPVKARVGRGGQRHDSRTLRRLSQKSLWAGGSNRSVGATFTKHANRRFPPA